MSEEKQEELKPTGMKLFGMEIFVDDKLNADEWYIKSRPNELVPLDEEEAKKCLNEEFINQGYDIYYPHLDLFAKAICQRFGTRPVPSVEELYDYVMFQKKIATRAEVALDIIVAIHEFMTRR